MTVPTRPAATVGPSPFTVAPITVVPVSTLRRYEAEAEKVGSAVVQALSVLAVLVGCLTPIPLPANVHAALVVAGGVVLSIERFIQRYAPALASTAPPPSLTVTHVQTEPGVAP